MMVRMMKMDANCENSKVFQLVSPPEADAPPYHQTHPFFLPSTLPRRCGVYVEKGCVLSSVVLTFAATTDEDDDDGDVDDDEEGCARVSKDDTFARKDGKDVVEARASHVERNGYDTKPT